MRNPSVGFGSGAKDCFPDPRLHIAGVSTERTRYDRAGQTVNLTTETKPKLLVVDDEQVIATTMSLILSKAGFEVSTFFNAESVLERIHEERPDLVISDVAMPGMNGVDMAIALRRVHPELKILLFSGHIHTSEQLLAAAAQGGHSFDLLAKPLQPLKLIEYVRQRLT